MKSIFTVIISIFSITSLISQTYNWKNTWGYNAFGQIGQVYAMDVGTDQNGNSYTLSSGNTQVDFDPSGSILLGPSAGCGAITKFDQNGSVVWVKFITKISGTSNSINFGSIYVRDNYIYFGGQYNGDYDFNPSPTVTNSMGGSPSNFIAKWDLDGNYQWAKSYGTSGTNLNDINVDENGFVYFTGSFTSGMSFSGAGSVTPIGGSDIYICKIDNFGNGQWIYSYGSPTVDEGTGITTLADGSVFLTGYYSGAIDFDPTSSFNNKTSVGGDDIFLQKINSSGNVVWTNVFGSTGDDRGLCINADNDYNIILSGSLSGQIDFDISSNTSILNSPSSDTYICKFKNDATIVWAKMVSGSGGFANSSYSVAVTTDANNSIYVTGRFNGTIDFDPSVSVSNLTSSISASNTYILKLYKNGLHAYSGSLDGTSSYSNWPNGIAASGNGIFIAGLFKGVVDFNPASGLTSNISSAVNSSGVPDYSAYVLKLNQCNPSSSVLNENSCSSYTAPDGQIYTQSGNYLCVIPNTTGCDSLITINLTIGHNTSSSITVSECGSYTAPDGQIYSIGGNYSAIIPNAAGCDSTITINLTINSIPSISAGVDQTVCEGTPLTLNGFGGVVYSWDNNIVNGISFIPPVGINEYIVTGTSVNGCFNKDTIIVTVNTLPIVTFSVDVASGCAPLNVTITNTTMNSTDCSWSISDGTVISGCGSVSNLFNQSGCFDISLTITDLNGCLNTSNATDVVCIENKPTAEFTASTNSFSQPGEQIVFTNNSTGSTSYKWNFGDLSPFSTLVDPTHIYEDGVLDYFIVELIAFSPLGCSDTSFLTIYNTSIIDSVNTDVFIPTGFSPNNDNENDNWTIKGLEKYPYAIINVFNRWGQLLFEGGQSNSTWNGLYQGEILPTADYYYIVDLGNGTKFNGVVTLKQ